MVNCMARTVEMARAKRELSPAGRHCSYLRQTGPGTEVGTTVIENRSSAHKYFIVFNSGTVAHIRPDSQH